MIQLAWEDTHRDWSCNSDPHKEGNFVFPIQTSRGNSRASQPVERDVVGDAVAREALRLTIEHACNQFVAARVMVQHPCCKADRRILQRVQRLRTIALLLSVGEAVREREVELIVCPPLVRREAERRRHAGMWCCCHLRRRRGLHVGVDGEYFSRRLQRHLLGHCGASIAAVGEEPRVPEALHQQDPGACDAHSVSQPVSEGLSEKP